MNDKGINKIVLLIILAVSIVAGVVTGNAVNKKQTKRLNVELAEQYMENDAVHNYADATCTKPRTCVICGKIEGDVLEHDWLAATSQAPKTCSVCGATDGEPLKPFVEENGIVLSKETEYKTDYVAELCTTDVTSKKDYEGMSIDKGDLSLITIEAVDVVENTGSDTKTITIKYRNVIDPEIIVENSAPNQAWSMALSQTTFMLVDYYSGLCIEQRSTKGNEVITNSADVEWNGKTSRIEYTETRNVQGNLGSWADKDNNSRSCTYHSDMLVTLVVTVPKDYDGLTLWYDKQRADVGYIYNDNYADVYGAKPFVEVAREEDSSVSEDNIDYGRYVFVRVSDIVDKF